MTTLEYLEEKFEIDSRERVTRVKNWNRTIMAKAMAELGFKIGAEIGVAQGFYSKILLDNNPKLKLFMVDIWDTYDGYHMYGRKIRAYYQQARRRVREHEGRVRIIKKLSMDAVKDFPDNSLDFVFIDAAHDFMHVAEDVNEWSRKVRPGGIVFGHDYKRSAYAYTDVKDCIPAWCYAKRCFPLIEFIPDVIDPFFRRDNPCWGFVRQETDRLMPPEELEFR
jgi:predicted O-methyltransferase YrrM